MNNMSSSISSQTAHSPSISLLTIIKKIVYCLLLTSLLNGCWAPNIKAPVAKTNNLQSVLVVAVEGPPLEIYPDPIENRIPVYGHYRNMAIPVDLDSAIYTNAAGIVIAGQISADDLQNIQPAEHSLSSTTLANEFASNWSPSKSIAQLAQSQLSAHSIHSVLSRDYYPLPMTNSERNAELNHWYHATQDWYAQKNTTRDYAQLGKFDAVLEVGIANYRIFEGQTSLQVLLKLIDPVSRRVIARSRADTFDVDNAALNSLDTDSQAFKRRIANMGERLLSQALKDIGLPTTAKVAVAQQ